MTNSHYTHIQRAVELESTNSNHESWKERGPGYYASPELHFGKNFWKQVRAKLKLRHSEEDHIQRAVELRATSKYNKDWKERGPGYYANPEIYFGKNFWKKVRAKLGVVGKYDEKYSEEDHIQHAVELGTSSIHNEWKERDTGYYARPELCFGKNFWKKVRAKLGKHDEKYSEEEHILRAVELGATCTCCDAWKERGPGYYAHPELCFGKNFWKKIREKLGVVSWNDEKYSEEDHIQRAVELRATSVNHDAWKKRGPGYYSSPEIYFGKSFWKKVRNKINEHNSN